MQNIPDFIKKVKKRRRREADGLRPPRLQELRPARHDHQEGRVRGLRSDRQEPAARHRPGAGTDRARRRVLRQAQALPERRLLLGPDLPGHEVPDGHVPGPLRHPARLRLARAVAGDAARSRSEDRAAAPDLHRPARRDFVPIEQR